MEGKVEIQEEKRMVYASIVAVLFAGDFFLKKQVERHITKEERKEICKGKIVIRKYYNRGAALNLMEKSPKLLRIICGAIILILGIVWYPLLREKKNPGILLGISLILGGGASNLYDRITKGHVVDYFSFRTPWERLNRIVFNISDMFIFLGSILIVIFGSRK